VGEPDARVLRRHRGECSAHRLDSERMIGGALGRLSLSDRRDEDRGPKEGVRRRMYTGGRIGSRHATASGRPPTGVLMPGVLGELAFYYGACWLHHRSAQRRGE
jgi:hypothetical protein